MPAFTISIINQLAKNLERIRSLGVPKIVVTAIEPMGCLPQAAASSSYQNCSEIWNLISSFHNQILQQTVLKLNSECEKSVIKILDLYSAFRSAFKSQKHHTGNFPICSHHKQLTEISLYQHVHYYFNSI